MKTGTVYILSISRLLDRGFFAMAKRATSELQTKYLRSRIPESFDQCSNTHEWTWSPVGVADDGNGDDAACLWGRQ